MEYILPIIVLGIIALIFGISLSVTAKVLAVKVDPVEEQIRGLLAGGNCGACGYAGCDAFAKALRNGKAKLEDCPVTQGDDKNKIAELLGTKAEVNSNIVHVFCGGGANCVNRAEYRGRQSCKDAAKLSGGHKGCVFGCLGLSDCLKVCPSGAITMNRENYPEIDRTKCINCGLCVSACPKKVIRYIDKNEKVTIACNNAHKGKAVRTVCACGCLACGICAKVCDNKAVEIKNNLPHFDKSKCTSCGKCVEKCPAKCINLQK